MTDDRLMRESQFRWSLIANGKTYVMDKKDGGKVTSSDDDYRAGGMPPAEPIGGEQSTDVITLTRGVRTLRDQQAERDLKSLPGNTRGQLIGQWLDARGIAFGTPSVINGLITGYTPPNHDSMSTSVAMLAVDFKPDGAPLG